MTEQTEPRKVAEATAAESGTGEKASRRWWWEPAYYLLVGLATVVMMVPVLHLPSAHLGVPFGYSGDALSVGTHVKNILEHGWIDSNPYVGAPEGRHGNDFPGADNLHLMVIAAFGAVSSSYAVVLNAYFLLTFPLIAMAAAWFFRVMGIGRVLSGALALLYAFAPYHFYRGEDHLFLAAYFPVPLAAVLIYRALSGESLWSLRDAGRRWARFLTARNLGTFLILLLLGTASTYYSVFTLLFLSFAGVVAVAQDRRWRRLVGVVAAQVLLMVVMVANMLPNLLYQRAHGANLVALVRKPVFTERYDFKLSSLLLPWPHHRVGAFASFRQSYDNTFPFPSETPALGVVSALGLLFLFGLLITTAVRGMRPTDDEPFWSAQRRLAVLSLAGFLLGTVGGLSTLFALFVTDALRGWNRLSIFLSAFCLAAVGLLVQRAVGRAATRRLSESARPGAVGVAAALLVLIGLFDQTPSAYPPNRAVVLADWTSDQSFVDTIESRLPAQAIVFQLPYMFYPEAPRSVEMHDSDQFRFYLHSATLRWTYGGIRGRAAADWSKLVAAQPALRMAAMLAAARIDGIEVFRAGYLDGGAALEAELRSVLGTTPVVSPNGKYSFWDTRPFADQLRAAHPGSELDTVGEHVLLHPVGYPLHFPGDTPRVLLDNGRDTPQPATVSLMLEAPDDGSAIVVTWPDGNAETVAAAGPTVLVTRDLVLAPGQSSVRVRSTSGARLTLESLDVGDPVLTSFTP
jgi:hypothetical protein